MTYTVRWAVKLYSLTLRQTPSKTHKQTSGHTPGIEFGAV